MIKSFIQCASFALLLGEGMSASETLTIASMADANLVEHGTFSDEAISSFKGWNFYPDGTQKIVAVPSEASEGGYAAKMQSGTAVLALHSDRIPVKPNTAYTLSFEQKQEEIHIGFGMGGAPTIRWFSALDAPAKPLLFTPLDGSFGWRTVSHSFVSLPDAHYVQISLGKRGMPGDVYYRNIRFAEGTLKKELSDLAKEDFVGDSEAYGNFSKRLSVFHADKGGLTSPELTKEREEIEAAAQAGMQKVHAVAKEQGMEASPSVRSEVVWAEMLKGAQGFQVTPDSPFYEEWRALKARLDAYKSAWLAWHEAENPSRIRAGMKREFGEEKSYGIGVSSSMLKVGRNDAYTGPITKRAVLSLAREEEENLQLTLVGSERDLDKIAIEVTSLQKDGAGKELEGSVSVYRIDQVETQAPQYAVDRVGYWPDIVFPSAAVEKVMKGSNQSFWINVRAKAIAEAGKYQGRIRILEDGKLLEELPLEVTLWDITLPRPGKFKVVGRFSPSQLKEFYKWEKLDDKVVGDWNHFIFSKRWNSTDPFATGLTPNEGGLKAAVEEGINAINLVNISQLLKQDRPSRTYEWPDQATEEKIVARLKASYDSFRAVAGEDHPAQLYVFAFDEQHDLSQYPLMKHVFNLAKKTLPGIKTITTTTYSPLDELVGAVDAWVPLLGSETSELVARGEAGDERWFYIYGHPFHPFPNASLVDYPGVEGRVSFWLASRLGYTGFLHWLMNGWAKNTEGEDRWPDVPWNVHHMTRNGEGNFLYPGKNREPIASVRFEIIRDGIEDWELIQMLKDAVAAAPESDAKTSAQAVLSKVDSLTPDAKNYTSDDSLLMSVREEVAHALIALRKQ